jgi:hypothetical protein
VHGLRRGENFGHTIHGAIGLLVFDRGKTFHLGRLEPLARIEGSPWARRAADGFTEVAGPSMLGIGCPDRHVLPHATSLKFALTVTRAPSRVSGFVLGWKAALQAVRKSRILLENSSAVYPPKDKRNSGLLPVINDLTDQDDAHILTFTGVRGT